MFAACLIHTYDVTHSCVRHNSFMFAMCLIHVCDVTHSCVRHNSFMFAMCLIHVCDVAHSCVRHNSFMCVSCLIHVCDVTHSCVWCDSSQCVSWPVHVRAVSYGVAMISRLLKNIGLLQNIVSFVRLLQKRPMFAGSQLIVATSYACELHDVFSCVTWLFICGTWLIHVCEHHTHTYMYAHTVWCLEGLLEKLISNVFGPGYGCIDTFICIHVHTHSVLPEGTKRKRDL